MKTKPPHLFRSPLRALGFLTRYINIQQSRLALFDFVCKRVSIRVITGTFCSGSSNG